MDNCPICYNHIYIGIKQYNCFNSHYICYTCYYNSNTYKCCMCRRNSGIYNICSYNKKIEFITNDIPDQIDEFYHILNHSYQTKIPIKKLITLNDYQELYIYLKGSIINLYLWYSFIFYGMSCLFYILFIIEPSFHTIISCYYTVNGTVCKIINYNYVYIVSNIILILLSIMSFIIGMYFMINSIKIPNNYFKKILFKKYNII